MFKKIDLNEIARQNKVGLIIGAILALVIGVLCVISPFYFGAVLVWVAIALVGVLAIGAIFRYIKPKAGSERNGANLALAIIILLCVVGLILLGLLGKSVTFKGETFSSMEATTIRLLGFGSIFFGVLSVVNNILLLCNINNFDENMRGLFIARSIFGIIVGVLMCIFPFVMFTISVLIGGIYLIIISIAAIVLVAKLSK